MITATAFQIFVSNNSPIKGTTDTTLVTLEVSVGAEDLTLWLLVSSALCHFWPVSQGVLPGAGDDVPTIVITAHYDSYGLAPVGYTEQQHESVRFNSATTGLIVSFHPSGCPTERTLMAAVSPSCWSWSVSSRSFTVVRAQDPSE